MTKRGRRLRDPLPPVGHISFPHTWLSRMRGELLADLSREHFCILLGKREEFEGGFCVRVLEMLTPGPAQYQSHSIGHVSPDKKFVMYALSELQERFDIDTLIDVHTHPFSDRGVSFSGIDDNDEIQFLRFLTENFENIGYASIVLSQHEYQARYWTMAGGEPADSPLELRAPTFGERISRSGTSTSHQEDPTAREFLSRTSLGLGSAELRSVIGSGRVIVVGLGGLGSVVAENLVHMGFEHLVLVDHDTVEHSNLNRIVGAYWEDADAGSYKVDVVARHLKAIRPTVQVRVERKPIEEVVIDREIAQADWIVIATDSHSSRFAAQELSFKYFIPFVSAGVAITIDDNRIADYSGEVIVVRPGDRYCLTCLNRLNPTKIALERALARAATDQVAEGAHSDQAQPDVERLRGYVSGATVIEPAVKTLNSVVGALAVEQLVDQYIGRCDHQPILVYERNAQSVIFADHESVSDRNRHCITCDVVGRLE
jgi:molybdopterin/thiamine biosynthesis adenylyltransferase